MATDGRCGPGGLTVRDIPEGASPTLPPTWPELPLLLDSPNYDLHLEASTITVEVPHHDRPELKQFNFDGVAAGLQVNANLHAPLLCVTEVFDIASGDLSLPGVIE